MTKSDRANFGSKLGVILASEGSAVGLGNIWRFPFETGNHGGAAFIFVYLVCVLILGKMCIRDRCISHALLRCHRLRVLADSDRFHNQHPAGDCSHRIGSSTNT